MRTPLLFGLVSLVVLLGCGDGDGGRDRSRDLVRFEYSLGPAFGFCLEAGLVVRAEIRVHDGGLTVAGTIAEEGVTGRDPCIPMVTSGRCFVERSIAERALSDREQNDVEGRFRSIRIEQESEDRCGSDDPCLESRFSWTTDAGHGEVAEQANSGFCAPWLAEDDVDAVTALVTRLLLDPR